ncbi:hypothetical protein [Streptomyces sp. SID161]|uniref:hypothetical protein n=1 Tax=Streptomyces sp. SID161 TaxID=2690251 RepID=UPI00136D2295|nr:hypothetical protein [Streptomyces sp. SID161]MYW49633.1 hypothetical protein [Streptomyces sp. SID161]
MAASYLSPYVGSNERSIPEAVELLAESGHPVSRSTLERLCRRNGVKLTRHGRTNYACWTDLLHLHRDWVNARS